MGEDGGERSAPAGTGCQRTGIIPRCQTAECKLQTFLFLSQLMPCVCFAVKGYQNGSTKLFDP